MQFTGCLSKLLQTVLAQIYRLWVGAESEFNLVFAIERNNRDVPQYRFIFI